VIGDVGGRTGVDVTSGYAALRIQGPLSRELFARFCALDLRPNVTPPGAFRPGSVARTPGMVLCEAENTYLALFGAAVGEYVWTVVEDAGRHLGGGPIPYA
jgi:sarcosine oxidase gamma subunit